MIANAMKRRNFLAHLLMTLGVPALAMGRSPRSGISVQLLRHATMIIQWGDRKILVDPMFASKGEMDPVQNCGNEIRIPMVDLPVTSDELNKLLSEIDLVVVTHTHRDHWDAAAQKLVDKQKTVFCQPADVEKIKGQAFVNVAAVEHEVTWEGLKIIRTGGQHGTGEIGQKMGVVSGFVFDDGEFRIYVAGDTVWCDEVSTALTRFKPDVVVLNTGGAKFLTGGPITMTPADVLKVHEAVPESILIAVHMDTVNHCVVKRTDLRRTITGKNLDDVVRVPEDGERLRLAM